MNSKLVYTWKYTTLKYKIYVGKPLFFDGAFLSEIRKQPKALLCTRIARHIGSTALLQTALPPECKILSFLMKGLPRKSTAIMKSRI